MIETKLTISKESEVSYTLLIICGENDIKLGDSIFTERDKVPVELTVTSEGRKKTTITRRAMIDIVDGSMVISIPYFAIENEFTFESTEPYMIDILYRCGENGFVSNDVFPIGMALMELGPNVDIHNRKTSQIPLVMSVLTLAERPYTSEQLDNPAIASIVEFNKNVMKLHDEICAKAEAEGDINEEKIS